ncbi:MAG: hypothetical protein MJZ74_03150 [Muribaculaceae bacterium]|nr:hypothetical protein [Muribaculaceae bacterium]
MNRDEAIARGIEVKETQHSMKRRSPWHDYHRKGVYMLTLVVNRRMPLLGKLKGDVDSPRVKCSELGNAILNEEIPKINKYYPQVTVWKTCIMPDHIHLIVSVKEDMPPGKHLGMVVAGFKGGCSKAAMHLSVTVPCAFAQGDNQSGRSGNGGNVVPLFEKGYNDKILLHEGQLNNWKRYLDDNPRRLLLKRLNPQFFTVLHNMEIAGHKCQVVGNRFLLDIPDKVAVIVHRRYSIEENARLREEWLACGERGGVLVSAAIAPKEKDVLREAMNRGYRIILLRENGFPELYKPSGESFDACSQGLLLQISPWAHHMEKKAITRTQCLELNALAEKIACP